MPNILKRMAISVLNLQPVIDRSIRLSDDMQQTLAMLCAYGTDERKIIGSTDSGVLFTGNSIVKGVWNETGSGAGDNIVGADISCSECLIIANPDNAGRLWVKPYGVAAADSGVPLDKGGSTRFVVNNLKFINVHVVADGDKVIVIYSQ